MRVQFWLSALACWLIGSGLIAAAMAAHLAVDVKLQKLVETAVLIQLTQGAAVLAAAQSRSINLRWPASLALIGCLVFCGSLYARAAGLIDTAPLAPLGGGLMIVSWFAAGLLFITAPLQHPDPDL